MRITWLIGLAGLSLSTSVNAEWFKIAETQQGSVWYIDPSHVKLVGTKMQAWIRSDGRGDRTVKWAEMKELLSFDCSADTVKTLSVVEYDSYGKIIASQSVTDYGYGYDPVVPDTMAEAAEKVACSAATAN